MAIEGEYVMEEKKRNAIAGSQGLYQDFPRVVALDDVSLSVRLVIVWHSLVRMVPEVDSL